MMTQMDDGISKLLNALKKTKQLSNTLIIFSADVGHLYSDIITYLYTVFIYIILTHI